MVKNIETEQFFPDHICINFRFYMELNLVTLVAANWMDNLTTCNFLKKIPRRTGFDLV